VERNLYVKMTPMGRRPKPPPADYLATNGVWPDGPYAPDAPPYVVRLAHLAQQLRQEAEKRGWSQRALADATDVNLNTINYLYAGKVIPDTATLATLETALCITLWPEDLI
jgi:ribosome-binding protein aMBF1 (putative translation factor)